MLIVKIGGGKGINCAGVIKDLSELDEQFIIVHGANAYRDELAAKLNIKKEEVTSVSGYSSVLSDENTIDLQMMAYAGLRNKKIIELCQQNGINAVGLSGLDGKVIQGRRNRGIRVKEGDKVRIVRDFSGKPKEINTPLLKLLLDNGYTPVLCVPILDEENIAINSENDDIVALLEAELHADKVIQLIEAPGFLEDASNPESLVAEISKAELVTREEQVSGRMKRKILALRKLFDNGASKVIISDGRIENPITHALAGGGTVIQ